MHGDGLVAHLPIWTIFLVTLALALLSVEGGYQWARRKNRAEKEGEAPVGAMVGALLGLLALLLAFTFGMAADRYHDRKVALLQETEAIRNVHWQAGTIPEPFRSDTRGILREYVEARLRWTGTDRDQAERDGRRLLDRLSALAGAAGAQNPGTMDVFLDSVERVSDLHEERTMLREQSHIPWAFMASLIVLAGLALASMGYHGGVAGSNRSPVMVAVAIAFSVVIMLITDLDRPGEGFINVSQRPMVELQDWIARSK